MLVRLIAGLVCGVLPAAAWCVDPAGTPLLTDATFARGFQVIDPQHPDVVQGHLQRDASAGKPAWRLVQWTSRWTIAGVEPAHCADDSVQFTNAAKSVTLGPADGPARGVRLRMQGGYEYDGRLRKPEEPWPHLLIEQPITGSPSLAELSSLRFRIACQLRLSEVKSDRPLEPWHCAQFQAFVTVANCNPASPGKGDFLWFGIPLYDSRYRQPVEHASLDTAGSHKFIYTPAGSVYSDQAAADGQWLVIDRDLLPLIHDGLERAAQAGFMKESRDPANLRVTSINLGWELTGPLDVEMHVRDLHLEATRVLERDWLFQAMGEPLSSRAAQEIEWSRALAARLSRRHPTLDLSAELSELHALEQRLHELRGAPAAPAAPAPPAQDPSWIWYPDGDSARNAPAAVRYFRRTFHVPSEVRSAVLRVATDDACEVFLNGTRLGAHDTWQRTAVFVAGPLLQRGDNLLAVRAENRPAPSDNPAGLIVQLAVTLMDGQQLVVVSDESWRSAREPQPQWEQQALDDSLWESAAVSAPWGGGPWGKIAGLGPDVHDDPVAAYATEPPPVRELYFAVRQVKRRILFQNPVLDFTQLLLIDQPLPQGPINPEHEAIHRMGITAVPGGRLLVLDGLFPGGRVRPLAPDQPGSFWRPELSFDACRVLFCFKPHDEKSFHLYEMNIDGSGVRQLTDSDYDDIDPIYLPDGRILFTTTRGNSYVRCGPFIYSYTLALCDADGGNVYLISHNGEPDFVPALLHDGRVIYSRWEYSDKPLWRLQALWTTNQDGTGTAHFWGNQSVWPDHLSEPRPIPGSRRVMFSGVGHHDWWSGSIGIIDPLQGRDFPHGLTKVTMDLPWPEVSAPPEDRPEADDYHAAGRFTGYKTAYPLSEEDFLVSARGLENKFRLYLMDVHGNRDLIYEGVHNVWHAVPVRPRPVPPRQTDRVAWPGTGVNRGVVQPGTFVSADVYEGVPDLPRGMVRYLRVWQLDYKTYSTWHKTFRHSGPPVSIVQEEGVKRILSEVPVEADGSVHFQAPAGRALFFQLLDEQRRCVHTMRSFTGLMPGEQRGCIGCHEGHSAAPPRAGGTALHRSPTPLSPPPWGTESISYERFAQPVLDAYCVRCHQGQEPGAADPNLMLRPGHNVFKEPYLTLVGSAGWGNPVAGGSPGYGIAGAIPVESGYDQNDPSALTTLRPMQYLSPASRLIELAASGDHYGVRVDSLSLHRLIAWVDACCPFMGEEELRALGDPDFPGIDQLPIRPRVATAPVIDRP